MTKFGIETLHIVPALAVCKDCKHYTQHLRCKAFPDGIPDEIAFNGMPHDKKLPDQKNNIVFEKKDK